MRVSLLFAVCSALACARVGVVSTPHAVRAPTVELVRGCWLDPDGGCVLVNDVPVDTFGALGPFKSEKLGAALSFIKRTIGLPRFKNEIVVTAAPDVLYGHLKKVLNTCAANAFWHIRFALEQPGVRRELRGAERSRPPRRASEKWAVIDADPAGYSLGVAETGVLFPEPKVVAYEEGKGFGDILAEVWDGPPAKKGAPAEEGAKDETGWGRIYGSDARKGAKPAPAARQPAPAVPPLEQISVRSGTPDPAPLRAGLMRLRTRVPGQSTVLIRATADTTYGVIFAAMEAALAEGFRTPILGSR